MSGPKSYSVSVFDKQLKQIFMLQGEISELWVTLKSKKLLGIETSFDEYLAKNQKRFNEFFNPFGPVESGTITQDQFDHFYNRIHLSIEQMRIFKEELKEEVFSFENIEKAYNEYIELKNYLEKLTEDFQILKSDFTEHIRSNNPETSETEELIALIDELSLSIQMPVFDQSFVNSKSDWKNIFDQKYDVHKKQMNQLARNKTGIIGSINGKLKVTLASNSNKPTGRLNQQIEPDALIQKINEAISSLRETSEAAIFYQRLTDLLKKHNKNEVYYFAEFLEEIAQSKSLAELKEAVNEISKSISTIGFYPEQTEDVNHLTQKISTTLAHYRLKINDVENLKNSLEKLKLDKQRLRQQKFAENQERNFIKARLISELQELDYEVMTDMNVIDFEKDNSFLFQTPGQENFINLRFDQQGQLLYNFLIPENRDNLTHEKTQFRLAEMQQTCDEFKEMLAHLKSKGLNINLEKEIEASSKALIQLPARFASFKADAKRKSASKSPSAKLKRLQ